MKHFTPLPAQAFSVLSTTRHSQAAVMVLEPNQSTGGPDNYHLESDQWLYVVSGSGRAVVGNDTVDLKPGVLLLIEAGETHEINNPGDRPLETLNFYAPPEY